MIISIDRDAPHLYRLPGLRYHRLRRKLTQCFRALQVLGYLQELSSVEVRRSSTGKGFHVLLAFSRELGPEEQRRIRALCSDDPVRLARDIVRTEAGVRTGRLRHAKLRRGQRHYEKFDQKGTKIAHEILKKFLRKNFELPPGWKHSR